MEKGSLKLMFTKRGIRTLIALLVVMTFMLGITTKAHAASYTSKSFSYPEDIYIGSTRVVTLVEDVTVYFYTDGKIHIYSHSVSYKNKNPLCNLTFSTPTITNTDGSYSSTVCNVDISYLGTTYYAACTALIYSGYSSPIMDIF